MRMVTQEGENLVQVHTADVQLRPNQTCSYECKGVCVYVRVSLCARVDVVLPNVSTRPVSTSRHKSPACWFTSPTLDGPSVFGPSLFAAGGRKKLFTLAFVIQSVNQSASKSVFSPSHQPPTVTAIPFLIRREHKWVFFWVCWAAWNLFTLEDKTQQKKKNPKNTMTTECLAETLRRGGDGCFSLRWPSEKLRHYLTIGRQSLPARQPKHDMWNVSE